LTNSEPLAAKLVHLKSLGFLYLDKNKVPAILNYQVFSCLTHGFARLIKYSTSFSELGVFTAKSDWQVSYLGLLLNLKRA